MYEELYKEYMRSANAPRRKFATQEEWHAWVDSMAGSITDETFVAPEDAYPVYDNVKN